MDAAWTKSGDEVLKFFDVQPELGLNEKQIEANREKFGYNELPAEEGKSLWALIGRLYICIQIYFSLFYKSKRRIISIYAYCLNTIIHFI